MKETQEAAGGGQPTLNPYNDDAMDLREEDNENHDDDVSSIESNDPKI